MGLQVPNLLLCHWSSQLFDLRAPSSIDAPVLLLNQPIIICIVLHCGMSCGNMVSQTCQT